MYKCVRATSPFERTFGDEIKAHLTWYQSRAKDCNVGIGPRSMLGMRVGIEVVCSLFGVSHCLGSQTVECINEGNLTF